MFYDNAVCDGCGEQLLENEDVVVCPVCGTPQHRKCYEVNNKCVNEHLHESGFEWINSNPPEAPIEAVSVQPFAPARDEPVPVGIPMPALDVNPVFYEKSGLNPNDEFDGVKVHEAVSYTQVGAKSYVKKFARSDGKKHFISWNWGAFFFSPAWFFYRKLYKLGFIFLALGVAVNLFLLPQNEKIDASYESMNAAYTEYADSLRALAKEHSEENEKAVAVKQAAVQKQIDEIAPSMALIFLGNFFVPNLIAALIANGFYKRKMLADINIARTSTSDERIMKYTLLRRGGVALIPALAALLLESYLPSLILQAANYFIK